jgi:ribosomal protein S18 acetylase RimI-like enzyme
VTGRAREGERGPGPGPPAARRPGDRAPAPTRPRRKSAVPDPARRGRTAQDRQDRQDGDPGGAMTTTLRPDGPEQAAGDGIRIRGYRVCVNGRPVGRVELVRGGRYGVGVGRLQKLEIGEGDRRRGRGTVAALAGEEVLRSWGCRHAEVSVPADAPHALRMAASLGYAERSRNLTKDLPRHPRPLPLPPGGVVRPLAEAEYRTWLERGREEFLGALTASGLSRADAEARGTGSAGLFLPGGEPAPGTVLLGLEHDGHLVARLRLRAAEPAWVFSVEVEAAHRGRGHGRTVMLAAERACHDAGSRSLGLTVFVRNTVAVRLYESLGYRPVSRLFAKPL